MTEDILGAPRPPDRRDPLEWLAPSDSQHDPHPPEGFLSNLATPENPQYITDKFAILPVLNRLVMSRQVTRMPDPFRPREEGEHVTMSRSSHTSVVVQIAGTVAQATGLNEDLSCAGAYGHDVGHPGKGHIQEKWFEQKTNRPFAHEDFALYLLETLLKIPLSKEVHLCIANHGWGSGIMEDRSLPEECRVVAMADKIGYVACDTFEALAILQTRPDILGFNSDETQRLIDDLCHKIKVLHPDFYRSNDYIYSDEWNFAHRLEELVLAESYTQKHISFSKSDAGLLFGELRDWLGKNFYRRADDQELEFTELDNAHKFLASEYPEYNAFLLLGILDDIQIRMAAEITIGNSKFDVDEFYFDVQSLIEHFNLPRQKDGTKSYFPRT